MQVLEMHIKSNQQEQVHVHFTPCSHHWPQLHRADELTRANFSQWIPDLTLKLHYPNFITSSCSVQSGPSTKTSHYPSTTPDEDKVAPDITNLVKSL